jgi:hypothetical protein
MLAYLPFFHPVLTFALLFKSLIYLMGVTTLLIIYYVLLQLGFELVSHNFGVKNFFFFNNNTSLIFTLLLLPYLLRFRLKKTFFLVLYPLSLSPKPTIHSQVSKMNLTLNPLPSLLTSTLLLITLFPLLHHLLISFFSIDFCNKEPTF